MPRFLDRFRNFPNRRAEVRFPARQPVIVTVLDGDVYDQFQGILLDYSRSGLRLWLRELPLGGDMEIAWKRGVVRATIVNVYPQPEGSGYMIGMRVERILDRQTGETLYDAEEPS